MYPTEVLYLQFDSNTDDSVSQKAIRKNLLTKERSKRELRCITYVIMINFLNLDQMLVGDKKKKMLSDFSEWRQFKEECLVT